MVVASESLTRRGERDKNDTPGGPPTHGVSCCEPIIPAPKVPSIVHLADDDIELTSASRNNGAKSTGTL
jgi:hypothetical protein